MKNNYKNPTIIIEELEKVDVLLISEQTDNQHIGSQTIIKRNFSVEDLL